MFFDQPIVDVLKDLTSSPNGLSSDDAKIRLLKYGKNELKEAKSRSKLRIFLEQFHSFIIYILIGAVIISLAIGEYLDGIAIFCILVLNAVFGFVQEYKAEKAIAALKKLASLKAKVIRDNKLQLIDSAEVVPGDILVLESGDKIPADARILECQQLQTQEASLTGESLPIKKLESVLTGKLGLGDQKNMVFASTIVTQGRAKAVVVRTGMQAEIGKIAGMLQSIKDEQTPLQKKLEKLGQVLGYLTLIVCAIVFGAGILQHESILPMFMASVALAVAVIPEGLPAVLTISLALGVQRMVKRNALVRNLPSVETLGATTVICTDKTGTLTKNEMTVTRMYTNGKVIEVSGSGYDTKGEFHNQGKAVAKDELELLLRIGMLNNDAELQNGEVFGDPTEASLVVCAEKAGLERQDLTKEWPRVDEIPFDSIRKRMVTIHDQKGKKVAFMKGAPDIVLKLCSKICVNGKTKALTEQDRKKILQANQEFANNALRVLGFAYKDVQGKLAESEFTFVGLQAMMDPPRPEVSEAIRKCKEASIRVIMITGDHSETAKAVAKQIGLEGECLNGADLDSVDLSKELEKVSIFARVDPEHKIRIVEALEGMGHVVAMTGDGVNDAPALKKAHIGISMGLKGTDVAKESSDMILTDDNFASIVNAVEEGRGIDDNIRKSVNYLLSCNFGELLVLFVAMMIGFKDSAGSVVIPLMAIQILWINLVTDGLPALALGVDPISRTIMQRKPRDPRQGIISKAMVFNVVAIGILICTATLLMFKMGLAQSTAKAQTLAFTTIVFLELARVQIIRKQYGTKFFSNKFLLLALLASLMMQLMVIYPPLSNVFRTVPLSLNEWGMIAVTLLSVYLIGSILGFVIRKVTRQMD